MDIVFLPLGGVGEIGMNLSLYGLGEGDDRSWLMVDCGVKFTDMSHAGMDLILPDISFIESRKASLLGLVLTHAHEDHFGALEHLWPRLGCPVYATPFTAALLREKLSYYGRVDLGDALCEHGVDARFSVGDFDIERIVMPHSIPESTALAIRTCAGNMLHSGDWRMGTGLGDDFALSISSLRRFGEEGCLGLVCDSTNALRDGHSISELDVSSALCSVISSCLGCVLVTLFASNVGRILAIYDAARLSGRSVILVGRSLWRVVDAARESGLIGDDVVFYDVESFGSFRRDEVLCICTGSQGESRAALSQISDCAHRDIRIGDGDTVIFSSRIIPGNERAVLSLVNAFIGCGVEVITPDDVPHLHVSGHPHREELGLLYDLVCPRSVVPVHGEVRHLVGHRDFALSRGVPESVIAFNGEVLRFSDGDISLVESGLSGHLYVDGHMVVDSSEDTIRARHRLHNGGIVMISLVLDDRGCSEGDMRIRHEGLPYADMDGVLFSDIIRSAVSDGLALISREGARRVIECDYAESVLRRIVRRRLKEIWGKKPVCHVFAHMI